MCVEIETSSPQITVPGQHCGHVAMTARNKEKGAFALA
jgi:hypothetical protein